MPVYSIERCQIRVWITPEASFAIADAASKFDISRGEYICRVVWDALSADLDLPEGRQYWFPDPQKQTTNQRWNKTHHAPGTTGRWSKWVQMRFTGRMETPSLFRQAAELTGHSSASAYIRHHLQIALKRDLGRAVKMPPSRSQTQWYGGIPIESVR